MSYSGTEEEQRLSLAKLKERIEKQKERNGKLAQEVRVLRKREIEIVKRWDLDDIDLVTERLEVLNGKKNSESKFEIYFVVYIISFCV